MMVWVKSLLLTEVEGVVYCKQSNSEIKVIMFILRVLNVLLAGSMTIGWAATFDKNRGAKTLSDLDPEQPEQSIETADSSKTAKEKEKRFEWNKRTIVGDYERVGKRSPKWDEPALKSLNSFVKMRSYGTNSVPNQTKEIAEPCQQAIDAGCDDVLVRYLRRDSRLPRLPSRAHGSWTRPMSGLPTTC
jgi:hypothetical protein